MVQKITFNLYHVERRDLMSRMSYVVQNFLKETRRGGIKHSQLARNIGVPKTRISEAYHRKYINETLIKKLVSHGYLSPDDFLERNLTYRQRAVLSAFFYPEDES
jgi:hypothetical protein